MEEYKVLGLIAGLAKQKAEYEVLEKESLNGPLPTNTKSTLGGEEVRQLKEQSRLPYGSLIIQTYCNGLHVLSITDELGDETDSYNWWTNNRMDIKMQAFKRDFYIGGSGFFELWGSVDAAGNKKTNVNVKSPKSIITSSIDRVNNEFADEALEAIELVDAFGKKKTVYKVWDTTTEYLYELVKGNSGNDLVLLYEKAHGFTACPVFPIENIVTSNSAVYSDLELLVPALKTMRTIQHASTSATYWQGIKQLILKNVDKAATRTDENGTVINLWEEIMDSIAAGDSEIIALPSSDAIGGTGVEFGQTAEANLAQLTTMIQETKNTLSVLSSLPLSIFDGTATPQNAEGAVQQYGPLREFNRNKGEIIANRLNSLIRLGREYEGVEVSRREMIMWANKDQTSQNAMSDTVSKLKASGVPLAWIAKHVMVGLTPNARNELLASIESQNASNGAVDAFTLE